MKSVSGALHRAIIPISLLRIHWNALNRVVASDWNSNNQPGLNKNNTRILQRKEEASTDFLCPDSFALNKNSSCEIDRTPSDKYTWVHRLENETPVGGIRHPRRWIRRVWIIAALRRVSFRLIYKSSNNKLSSNSLRPRDGNSRCVVPYR